MAGIFDKGIDTATNRRIEQIKTECSKEGLSFVDMQNITLRETNSAKTAIGSTLTSLLGGKASSDQIQIYTLQRGDEIQYYVQPFEGMTPLPGQHFKLLKGALKNPIQYRVKKKKSFTESMTEKVLNMIPFMKKTTCEFLTHNPDMVAFLKGEKLPFLKTVSHVWQHGTTEINLEWTLQASAFNQDTTIVSMQTGRYGMMGERTGLQQFREACGMVERLIAQFKGDGSHNVPITNTYYGKLVRDNMLSGKVNWKYAEPVKEVLNNIMAFEETKTLKTYKSLNEKKVQTVKANLLDKSGISPQDDLVIMDLTMMGSLKNALVFAPDKFSFVEGDRLQTVAYKDLAGIGGLKAFNSVLELVLKDGSTVKIPVIKEEELLKSIFTQLILLQD